MRAQKPEGRNQKPEGRSRTPSAILAFIVVILISGMRTGRGQDASPMAAQHEQAATSLRELVDEVEQKSPKILAARHGWKAAAQIPSQVSTPPDPQFMVQQLNVGSPRPFAGTTNSDFAYLGLGISQDLPYPGKLKLKGEAAALEAAGAQKHYEATRRFVVEQLKEAYFSLAYVQKTLAILDRNGELLDQIEKIAEAHYRVGQGNQAEVLKAQLQRTQLLRETAMHHQHMETLEARIKQILNRPPDSADLTAEELTETLLPYSSDELLARARTENPEVGGEQEMVRRQSVQLEAARKDFYPDFNLQYMWQHTGPQFRDYYVLTFGVKVPIYRSRKQQPEVAQAAEELNRSRREYDGAVQQAYFDVRDQYLTVQTSAQLLKIYREGLIPQSTATFQAGLAAYQSNRLDLQAVFSSFSDILNFDEEYWRTLSEHEIALARLEQLTGITLH
jgi:cobalt-zinc-cadmium efflux system outer membrane protein